MSQTNNTWLRAVITLKKLSDASTKTVYISNRPLLDYTGSTVYYPILRRISGLGTDGSKYIPGNSSGQIVLDNSPGSFGEARRFSDLLELYTEVEQSIAIYAAETTATDADPHADFELIATTIIKRGRQSPDTFTLDVESEGIPRRIVNRIVAETDTGIDASESSYTVQDKSLGRALPLVIGENVEVQPVLMSTATIAAAREYPTFAYATTFADDYINSGVQTYYAKSADGTYGAVSTAATTSTLYNGRALDGTETNSGTAVNGTFVTNNSEEIVGFAWTETTARVYTDVCHYFYFANATVSGTMGFRVYELTDLPAGLNATTTKRSLLANAKADLNDWDGSIAVRIVRAKLDKPVVTKAGKTYCYVCVAPSAGFTNLNFTSGTGGNGDEVIHGTAGYLSSGPGIVIMGVSLLSRQYGGMNAALMTDYPDPSSGAPTNNTDNEGLGYSRFQITQRASITNYTSPDLSTLDLVVAINGIKDDGSGTVTGSAGAVIKSPRHVARLLLMQWDGSSWANSLLSTTKYDTQNDAVESSTNALYRTVAGATRGRTGLDSLLNEVCRSVACRLVRHNGTTQQLALWPWGNAETNAQLESVDVVLTDENSTLDEVMGGDRSNIVNSFDVLYDRGFIYTDITRTASEGGAKEYRGVLPWTPTTYHEGVQLGAQSYALYGFRDLGVETFNYINTDAAAKIVARYMNAIFNFPSKIARMDLIDFWEFRALDLMDVVYILHPDLPSYYGTDPNAKEPVTDDGDPHFLADGKRLVQAKRYRGIVEGSQINWNLNDSGLLTRSLNIRLLTNENDPT